MINDQLNPRAIILTALPVEYAAVRAHLPEAYKQKGTIFEQGKFFGDHHDWEVFIAEIGKGNIGAALMTERSINDFQPDIILFVGVAGGFKDVNRTDVIAADKVYYYESGKFCKNFLARPALRNTNPIMVQHAKEVSRSAEWHKRIKGTYSEMQVALSSPKVFVDPIASGEQVFVSRKADVSKRLEKHYGDALAVEMEGFGFMKAASDHKRVLAMVIRGISDLIEGKSEDDQQGLQEVASRHASAFAFEFLAMLDYKSLNKEIRTSYKDDETTFAKQSSQEPTSISEQASTSEESFRESISDIKDGMQKSSSLIWNLPVLNPTFTGRRYFLEKLRRSWRPGLVTPVVNVISGLGGSGKTQLALQYAHQYRSDYQIVWWMRAGKPENLRAEFIKLADELPDIVGPPKDPSVSLLAEYAGLHLNLSFPKKSKKEDDLIEVVKSELTKKDKWLLIFDDARKQSQIERYLPPGGGGHILITSSNSAWRSLAEPIFLPIMDHGEAIDFLIKRTGQEDGEILGEIAKTLGYLPLALEQAGAYIDATSCPLSDYLQRFQDQKHNLPKILQSGELLSDDVITVATTWEMGFREIEKIPAARDLLNLCAFLAPDNIPQNFFLNSSQYLPRDLLTAVASDDGFDHAIAILKSYSFIERADNSLSIHILVQAVARNRMGIKMRKYYVERAVSLLSHIFPEDESEPMSWNLCNCLLPHAQSVTQYSESLEVASRARGRLLNRMGLYLYGCNLLVEAKTCLERALELTKFADPLEVARTFQLLHQVFKDMGILSKARDFYEQAEKIFQTAPDHDPYQRAIMANILGSILLDTNEPGKAKMLFEHALNMGKNYFKDEDPFEPQIITNLGVALFELQDLQEAREHFERARKKFEKILNRNQTNLNENNPTLATDFIRLSQVLGALEHKEEAKRCLEEAYIILLSNYGVDHPKSKWIRKALEDI